MAFNRNVIVNYIGYSWSGMMGIAFLPSYVKALGADAYGLVGVYTVLYAWIAMLDMGLTPTLNREVARLRAGEHTAESIRDLLRSIELIFAVIATLMVILVWLGSTVLMDYWLKSNLLPRIMVIDAIRIIGFVLASRWLEQIYRATILGMQDYVYLNLVQSVIATLRWGGAYVVVTFFAPSILYFFVWQGVVSILTAIMLMHRTYRLLPQSKRAGRFSLTTLVKIKKFAVGMSMSTILTFALTQTDKIVISRMLPLDQLGYYMLAASASGALLLLVTPMNNAIYPHFSELEARKNWTGLEDAYRLACEWMSAILIPAATVLVLFSGPVLLFWTGDVHMTKKVAPLLAVLALGTLFNGLMNVPYMLQLAHGWTSLSVKMNTLSTMILIPVIIVAVSRYGTLGAASAWLVLNLVSLVVSSHYMYSKIFPHVKWKWYRESIAAPLGVATIVGVILLYITPEVTTRSSSAAVVLASFLLIQTVVICALPNLRKITYARLRKMLAQSQSNE